MEQPPKPQARPERLPGAGTIEHSKEEARQFAKDLLRLCARYLTDGSSSVSCILSTYEREHQSHLSKDLVDALDTADSRIVHFESNAKRLIQQFCGITESEVLRIEDESVGEWHDDTLPTHSQMQRELDERIGRANSGNT